MALSGLKLVHELWSVFQRRIHCFPTGSQNGSRDAELAGLRVVVCEIGLRIYWFKQEYFLSLVAMLRNPSRQWSSARLASRDDFAMHR